MPVARRPSRRVRNCFEGREGKREGEVARRACQGLSQSRGMGIAPSQQPMTVPAAGRNKANSRSFEGLLLVTKVNHSGGRGRGGKSGLNVLEGGEYAGPSPSFRDGDSE
jgi:hypothetical protein